jgi:hypothetical protein
MIDWGRTRVKMGSNLFFLICSTCFVALGIVIGINLNNESLPEIASVVNAAKGETFATGPVLVTQEEQEVSPVKARQPVSNPV